MLKADLSDKKALADYESYDYWWDFWTFYAEIRFHVNQTWTREWFINTAIHELGHALGLPHAPPGKSQFMSPGDTGCADTKEICKFTNHDWETFLSFYNPPTLVEHKKRQERERIRIENMKKQLPVHGCYPRILQGVCF